MAGDRLPWRVATERALYGEAGFYRREPGPAAHFRTSVSASPVFAEAVLRLAHAAGVTTVVDIGAGRGELLSQLHERAPALTLVGVDVVPRPEALPSAIGWTSAVPDVPDGLLVANEWLDNVPVDVARVHGDGARLLHVDPHTGAETAGPQPSPRDRSWLEAWWPLDQAPTGTRAEIGWPRDDAWAAAVGRLGRGIALAVDYGHRRADRPAGGSLQGFRSGRRVDPVPDGSCDITSAVAIDSCAEAGAAAGATSTVLLSQRDALADLTPPAVAATYELARTDPASYLTALTRHGERVELRDPDGLGGFTWLLQTVGGAVLPAELGLEQRQL